LPSNKIVRKVLLIVIENTDRNYDCYTNRDFIQSLLIDDGGQYMYHPQKRNTPADVRNIATAARITKLNYMESNGNYTYHFAATFKNCSSLQCFYVLRMTYTDYCPKQH
jgi:hypothetical protein